MHVTERRPYVRRLFCSFAVLVAVVVLSMTASAQDATTTTGTIVSSSRNTVTIRSSTGQFQLYYLAESARSSASLPPGSQVRVVSTPGNEPGVRVASEVTVVSGAAAPAQGAEAAPVVPPAVRQLERDIERLARRFQVGVRGGVSLDPELVMLGAQAQVGPFFRSDIFFRPSIEFGIGEVTAMFAFNPEFIYRLPFSARQDRWTSYVGAGLGINLLHQDFERDDDDERIDFGDFRSDTALNIFGGLRNRNGMFLELKTSVYSDPSPTLRMVIGYNF
jgi:hypothetical protein